MIKRNLDSMKSVKLKTHFNSEIQERKVMSIKVSKYIAASD